MYNIDRVAFSGRPSANSTELRNGLSIIGVVLAVGIYAVASPEAAFTQPPTPVATPSDTTQGPPAQSVPSGVDPALLTTPVPDTVPEMLVQLRTRTDQIKELIDRGAFAAVYVPAFQAKDIALALDAHKTDLPEARRRGVGPAANRVVRGAYLLDAFGDLGNRAQIVEAYGDFAAAVKDIEGSFGHEP